MQGVRRVGIALGLVVAITALADPARAGPPRTTVLAAEMPAPGRTEVAGARWQGRIAVAGGFVPGPPAEPSRELWLFDPASAQWTRGPDLPGPRDHATLASLGTSLYLVGGYTQGLRGATTEAWRLDGVNGWWRQVADLATPRAALGLAAARGRLVAVGGANSDGVLRTTEVYDPGSDTWTAGPDLAVPREHFGATTVRGRVYAIGGRNPGNLTSVESIAVGTDGVGGEWREEPSLAFSRGGNGAAAVGGVACTAGGEEAGGTIPSIECLIGGRFVHVADLRTPRHGLAVVAIRGRLHIVSGGPRPGAAFSTTHEVLRLGSLRALR